MDPFSLLTTLVPIIAQFVSFCAQWTVIINTVLTILGLPAPFAPTPS